VADPRIFISMGTPYAPKYVEFRSALEQFFRENGVDPRILGVNEYPAGNPLSKIRDVMETCAGVVIVAYERKYVGNGLEKRSAPAPIDIDKKTYTTPWNHIESALAYSLDLPIYIICENGLTEEGLIETRLDWYVQRIDFHPDRLRDPAVVQSVRAWIDDRVRPRSRKPRAFQTLEGTLKFSEMTSKELWGTGAFIASIFAAGVAFGRFLPHLFK
jgi:hypothetical protein